jgi:hypothetical protein
MTEVKITRAPERFRRRPAWDWDGPSDLSSDDREELEALRAEVPALRAEVDQLRGEVAQAAEDVDRMRSLLKRVVKASPFQRRRMLRALRDSTI